MESNNKLALAEGCPFGNLVRYRQLVGCLIYLCFTRSDLSYCLHVPYEFMHCPREEHWKAALQIIGFLKGKPGQGILLRNVCDLKLYG